MFLTSCSLCSCVNHTILLQDKNNVYKILHYASLAVSSHNTQPWKVEVLNQDSILVYADTARKLNIVDPKGIELCISIGAFIENLDMAAQALGYNTSINLFNQSDYKLPLASIKLLKSNLPVNQEILRDIENRMTLRVPFDTRTIADQDKIKLLSKDIDRIIFVPANSPEGAFIAKTELDAYSIQARQKDAQDELAEWIRFSDKDVNKKRDGLTTAGMGIKGFAGFMVRNFFKPEDSKKSSFVEAGIKKTQNQIENCSAWILITADSDDTNDWLNIGRIYERINTNCRSLNIAIHPMNQIIEVPETENVFNQRISPDHRIRFIARIGYIKHYPDPVSKRRSVESFSVFK
jgi:hypothetical protein